ncbi:MAG: M2 family metallopeptidase, partial [Holophagales bacterium]|nr:M2 family metallopeptidase [Holophagales bacterium]
PARPREVVCYASAWCIDRVDDLAGLKMHRDQRRGLCHRPPRFSGTPSTSAYNRQPVLFATAPTICFHEAIGDTVALSLTRE